MSTVWTIEEHRDGDIATAELAGYKIRVTDADGDCSEWRITDPQDRIVANGSAYTNDHFEACRCAAWSALLHLMPVELVTME